MRILNLIENTEGNAGCKAAHGLSFYVETKKHRLLLDLGPSEETLANAKMLGVDLENVDTVILSHGHYDHSGGIIPFSKLNPQALIYMQASAFGEYYADEGVHAEGERYRYIGIDPEIADLDQIKLIRGNCTIDEELSLFTIPERSHPLPFTNRSILVKKKDGYETDEFEHEQYLVITDGEKHILLSGCAHNGILSILDEYRRLYKADPDIVISGFHLMKKTAYKPEQEEEIKEIARQLKGLRTKFYTGHCTGIPAYEIMKEIMGEQLGYVHSGEEIWMLSV